MTNKNGFYFLRIKITRAVNISKNSKKKISNFKRKPQEGEWGFIYPSGFPSNRGL
jgi:hypothetical protein